MSGFEFLAKAQETNQDIPIIIISGTSNPSEPIEILEAGAWDFIPKPIIDLRLLKVTIEKALDRIFLLRENQLYQSHIEDEIEAPEGDDAQYEIAQFYISDRIDNKQPDKAKSWFVKAASGVNVSYKQSLGLMLLIGDKLEQDSSKAFKYLLQAADGGDVYSMFVVGEMYVNGKGVVKNVNKSIEYLSKAIKNGYKLALFSLAQVFEKEASVRDFKNAFKLYFESAYDGHVKSQQKVADFYAAGVGVKKNVKSAYAWRLICRESLEQVNFSSIEQKLSIQGKNEAREVAATILKVIKENK